MNKIFRTLFSTLSVLAFLLAGLPLAPVEAMGALPVGTVLTTGQSPDGKRLPAGLQEAMLAASAEPFTHANGEFSTEYNGLGYTLNAAGLKAKGKGIQWGISLNGMGRGNYIEEVAAPKIAQTDNRLEYRRGSITKWYRDTAYGVQQGFTVHESPKGNGKLVLRLDLSTEMQGQLDKDGRGLSFAGPDGSTLRYDHLAAFDANGAELETILVYNPAQVVIQVDDRGANYPLTIDPLIYLEQKVLSSDGAAYGRFGISVVMDGDTALVGAFEDNSYKGAAYVFVRSGTNWTQQAKLTASDGAAEDYFGRSVALSGDAALVGASNDDIGANSFQGSVYVFTRNGMNWTQQAKLTASDGAAYDGFGYSVALDGDTALVGAPDDDIGANNGQGSVYVFTHSGATWSQQAKLTASDGVAYDYFGYSLALDGDTALVGAFADDIGANNGQGSAYVFTRSGTNWTQQARLTASDGAAGDYFGKIALNGDTALVGAPRDDDRGTDSGSVYVFTRSGTSWSQQAKLTASDGAAYDGFGVSVAFSGDTALVGAYYDDDLGSASGSAYVFSRSGTNWTRQAKLTASDGAAFDHFGISVALSGDTALVGADGDNFEQGSAYFYQAYPPDLGVSVSSGSSSPLNPGDTILLTTTVMNFGPSKPNGVMLQVDLPGGLTYVSHTATLSTYSPSTGVWNAGDLPAYVSATLMITATVNDPPTAASLIFKPRLLNSDRISGNNSASLKLTILPAVFSLDSQATFDGWVLESSETSNKGGTKNNRSKVLYVGDDALNRQYRGILSFNTADIPDNAVVTKVTLKVKKAGLVGTNPFKTHKGLRVDIRKGKFGTSPKLQLSDFQAKANKNLVGKFSGKVSSGWYTANLGSAAYSHVNLTGTTQFRLRFYIDDNNNFGADYFKFYSGNAGAASRPKLIIEYYMP